MRDPLSSAFLVCVLLLLPALAIAGARQLDTRPLPPRRALFVQTMVIQLLLLAIALLVARREGIPVWRPRAPDARWSSAT